MPYSFISTPVNVTGAGATTPTHITSIQLPSAGKWDVTYSVRMVGTPGGAALYGQAGGKYSGSEIAGTKGTGVNESSAFGRATITTTGPQTLNLRGWGTYQATTVDNVRTFLNADLLGAGLPGPAGPKGDTGLTGGIGPQGPAGAVGKTGFTGPVGATGATGAQGPQGPTGARGETGTAGKSVTVFARTTPPDSNLGVAGDIWYQY